MSVLDEDKIPETRRVH